MKFTAWTIGSRTRISMVWISEQWAPLVRSKNSVSRYRWVQICKSSSIKPGFREAHTIIKFPDGCKYHFVWANGGIWRHMAITVQIFRSSAYWSHYIALNASTALTICISRYQSCSGQNMEYQIHVIMGKMAMLYRIYNKTLWVLWLSKVLKHDW